MSWWQINLLYYFISDLFPKTDTYLSNLSRFIVVKCFFFSSRFDLLRAHVSRYLPGTRYTGRCTVIVWFLPGPCVDAHARVVWYYFQKFVLTMSIKYMHVPTSNIYVSYFFFIRSTFNNIMTSDNVMSFQSFTTFIHVIFKLFGSFVYKITRYYRRNTRFVNFDVFMFITAAKEI